jgi:EF-hand domain pair
MVAALKQTGITHACLGNEEVELPKSVLCQRLTALADAGVIVLNTNVGAVQRFGRLGQQQEQEDTNKEIQKQQALINELLPSYEPQSPHHLLSPSSSSTLSADLIHELLPSYEPQSPSSFPSSTASSWMDELLPSHHVVATPCGRVRIGLLGLLSDEASLFCNGTVRGRGRAPPIHNVLDAFTDAHENLVTLGGFNQYSKTNSADWLLPITHQSLARDSDLARRILEVQEGSSIILGGHEHTPMDVTISSSSSSWSDDSWVRIIKSATDARAVSLVDLYFDVSEESTTHREYRPRVRLGEVQVSLVDVTDLEPSFMVQSIVDSHRAQQEEEQTTALEGEEILHAARHFNLPSNVAFSSRNAKYQQTTVGAVFCTAIKEELQVDVAVLPGCALHGNVDRYDNAIMTYGQLKRELREPIRMVIVPMKRWQVQAAVAYSRRQRATRAFTPERQDDDSRRRSKMNDIGEAPVHNDDDNDSGIGCLQVDMEFENIGLHDTSFGPQDAVRVALPRSVLEIYCQIKQGGRGGENDPGFLLNNMGDALQEHGGFPADDDFYLADQVITRHCSKYRWYEIMMDNQEDMLYTSTMTEQNSLFQNLDSDAKGYLTRQDVTRMLTKVLKHEPSDQLVDDMIHAIDANDSGTVDLGELCHLLAVMEQEHGRGLSTSFIQES